MSACWFGFAALRPLQQEAIDAALKGRDALVVLPTGGGKSLCYQLPPLVADRPSVVVSPLIALMQDQVGSARFRATAALPEPHRSRGGEVRRVAAARAGDDGALPGRAGAVAHVRAAGDLWRTGGATVLRARGGEVHALRHPRLRVARVHCDACGVDDVVAFSCKGRGFCRTHRAGAGTHGLRLHRNAAPPLPTGLRATAVCRPHAARAAAAGTNAASSAGACTARS